MPSEALEYKARSRHEGRRSEVSVSKGILFRRFSPDGEDESQMGDLVFDNAFLGQPFDTICPCKRWFSEVILSPYIKYQQDNIHVAIDQASRRLVGYLTGSMGGKEFEKLQYQMVRRQVVSFAASLSMPWTFFDQSSRQFATHVIFKGESERPTHPDTGAHWHYQVDRNFRGRGIGETMMQSFLDDVINAGYGLIWAEVTSYPEKPQSYFRDRGWSIYDSKPTEIFANHVDFPVEILCITKSVSEFEVAARAA